MSKREPSQKTEQWRLEEVSIHGATLDDAHLHANFAGDPFMVNAMIEVKMGSALREAWLRLEYLLREIVYAHMKRAEWPDDLEGLQRTEDVKIHAFSGDGDGLPGQ
jgi:hypothetical protein